MDDQQILELLNMRSDQAIKELSGKYGKLCLSVSMHILHDPQDAEECVNDTFLSVWENIPPDAPRSLAAYLCGITRNLSLKKYRRKYAARRNPEYEVLLDEIAGYLTDGNTPENELLAKELSRQINLFLGSIRQRDRVIFIERYYFCKDIPEIAKDMGLTRNLVNVRLHRTKEKLKNYLKKEGLYD